MLLAAAAILIAAALFGPRLLAPRTPEQPPAPAQRDPVPPAPATPLAQPAESAATEAPRASATEAPPVIETPARGWRLQLELVDEHGQPVTEGVDVEHRLFVPQVTTPIPVPDGGPRPARGPRIDLPAESNAAAAEVLATQPARARVIVRRLGLYGESDVPIATGAADTWTRVVLHATTVVRGQLVDGKNAPLEGVDVLVRDDVPGAEAHTRVRTDAGGAFTVEALHSRKKNRIFVGDAAYPWVPPIDIDASAGDRTLEPIKLDLYAASFTVLRKDGLPAEGARLEGIGLEGGRFVAIADADGRARVTTLLRGRWRVNVSEATHGRATRAVEVPLEKDEPVLILLPR